MDEVPPDGRFWPIGGSEMAQRIRAHDWATTPLGPIAQWPERLKHAVDLVLAMPYPAAVSWGPDLLQIYNDGNIAIYGHRHPAALGRPFREGVAESADALDIARDRLFATGKPFVYEDRPFILPGRDARPFTSWVTGCWVPITDEEGRVLGAITSGVDTTERALAQIARRESEERKAFLLKVSDTLRHLADADEIERTAMHLLGERLGVNRVFYGLIDVDAGTGTVRHDFARDVPSMVGRYPLTAFQRQRLDAWESGRTTITTDSETEPTYGEADRQAFAAVQTRAAIAVPLVKDGRLVALLAVNQVMPRQWTSDEIELVTAVAERTWAAVERTRAQSALRESEERFRALVTAATYSIYRMSPDWRLMFQMDSDTLANTSDPTEDWVDNYILEEDRARVWVAIRHAIDTKSMFELEHRVLRADGRIGWMLSRAVPLLGPDGAIVEWFGAGGDVTARKRAETALVASETRLRTLMEGIPQLVWRSSDHGLWTWASPQWLEFTGQSQRESLGNGWLDAVHPDDRAATRQAWAAARPHGMLDVEYRVARAADGAWVWHHTRSVPVRDEQGRIVEWLGTSTDVQVLKELQGRQAILVAELQHRTLNLMGVVRSVADATIRSSADLKEFRAKFRDRVDALARVQRLLSRLKEGERVTFDEIIRGELAAAGALQEGGRVTLDGPDGVVLRSSTVQTFAMAIHELTTNALKYGALRQPEAHLDVRWRVETAGDGGQPWLHVDWRETGVVIPLADIDPHGTGQGRALIERALPYQLRARTSYDIAHDGVRCSIALPVSRAGGDWLDMRR